MQDWREAIGFLCRWCLLALACAAVVLVTWASVLASALVPSDREADMMVPDAIWARPGRAHLTGSIKPQAAGRHPTVALCGSAGTDLLLVPVSRERIHPRLSIHLAGVNTLRIIGIPYSRHAFNEDEAILEIIAYGRTVFLVDAALALDDSAGLSGCISLLWSRGEVAFLHNGRAERYRSVRGRLRRAFPGTPVVFPIGDHSAPARLLQTARALERDKNDRSKVVIITGDEELAASAAGRGFTAHLVDGARAPAGDLENLRVHKSLAKFKEYLGAEPIRH